MKRLKSSYDLDPWDAGELTPWEPVVSPKIGTTGTEWSCKGNNTLLSGLYQEVVFNDDMFMHWTDLKLASDLWMPVETGDAWFAFQFTLTGAWESRVSSPKRRSYGQVAGQMGVLHARWDCKPGWMASDSYVHLTAVISEARLRQWLGQIEANEPQGVARLRQFLDQNDHAIISRPITEKAAQLVRNTMACDYTGPLRAWFMEARFHDLAIEVIDALGDKPEPIRPLRSSERDSMKEASDLLLANLQSPPELSDVATQVGLSVSTLKRRFAAEFGKPPFAYLREQRMKHARMLLETGRTSVLEAADLVGYANPSNFTAAFRATFGLNPQQFLKQLRSSSHR
ncbi:helix-turn-helix transcriptional regulator [Phragmitibacter flavus]|uniref:Helix-turn-helix transcriptional regulator n=1 Tax=Phragmitibacter flavus TaxID=2576071 RepID=A0A5R8KFZ1_9BACT|nr:AraC family transcriptional regulator [Phragmitibacter flavus]TLD70509.1 helix-turn-helix transcriptional regulator [Phragmitibacter flavus]